MNIIFYIAAVVAIVATFMVITRTHAVHALLYMITSLLSVAIIFFILGAPFLAALEVIIYAGAIMVLFVFVVMMLNLGKETAAIEKKWLSLKAWIGPGILCLILLIELILLFSDLKIGEIDVVSISPKEVGKALYGKYILGVELVAMLLMSATVGAYHIGQHRRKEYHRFLQTEEDKLN